MTRKVKVIIAAIVVVLLSVAVVSIYFINKDYRSRHENDEVDPYTEEGMKKILNETFPSDVMIYGDEVDFKGVVAARHIDDLSEETLLARKDLKYKFLVIVNRENKLNLSVDELSKAKKVILDNSISFFYIGKDGLDKVIESGIVDGVFSTKSCGVGNQATPYENGTYRIHVEGFWTTQEEQIMKEEKDNPYADPDDLQSGKNLVASILLEEFVSTLKNYG